MKKTLIFIFLSLVAQISFSQEKTPDPFDFGKMWTFENPPKEWFKEAYGFDADDEWFEKVRKSSLKFATWCSASFVSPNGLIMTNHHCSRDVVTEAQKEGENFDKQGFYAKTLEEERKVEGLFVEQLIKVADITDLVLKKLDEVPDEARVQMIDPVLEEVKNSYIEKEGWKGLRLQAVSFYSGGKFSLYGYKKYDDIRLVLIPELDLGFYGGDPDNFTYPRYNLDCTFWRAYDENGQPVNSSENYFKFNPKGAAEGEPVFVIGNPGSTERYRTVAQLKFDRDYRYPMIYRFLKNRNDIMVKEYENLKKDPSKEFEAQALLNQIANIANGMKAYGGIIKGLNDPELFQRKIDMENYIRSKSQGVTYWDDLEKAYEKLNPLGWAVNTLSPSPLKGKIFTLIHQLYAYKKMIKEGGDDAELDKVKDAILKMAEEIDTPKERMLFSVLLNELKEAVYPGDPTMDNLLQGKDIASYIKNALDNTRFKNRRSAEKCLKGKKILKDDDPLVRAADILVPKYFEAVKIFRESSPERRNLESKIANQVFKVFGDNLPPDATFTLRISDGVIKGYEYNGTIAPPITTYFGLYDRHYSHGEVFPWSLPARWLDNPPYELLKAPLNTVSTNDIIGGNSGSPLINKNREAVGLIFDGNIESLPGNFIFDAEKNRTVSVHAGGIIAAMKYIYHADRLVKELTAK